MLEPSFEASFEEDDGPVSLKDNYPYFGDGTGRSEPVTIRNIKIRSESEPIASSLSSRTSSSSAGTPSGVTTDPDSLGPMKSDDTTTRRKTFYDQPRGTLEYTVSGRDTVDSVALQFGSTPSHLMRINHMSSRMIFPGQVFYVPDPTSPVPVVLSPTSPTTKKQAPFSRSLDIPAISQAQPKKKADLPTFAQAEPKSRSKRFGLRKSQSVRESKGSSWARKRKFLLRQGSDPPRPGRVVREASTEEEEADSRQFLKVDVKYITDGEGVVSGTMLVTPNAIMFDPNVSDPLVIDRGTGPYGVITQMDMVRGAAMYHDISAMNDKLKQNGGSISCPVYVPEKNQTKSAKTSNGNSTETDAKINQEISRKKTPETNQDSIVSTTSEVKGQGTETINKDDTQCVNEPDSTTDTDTAKDHTVTKSTETMPEIKSENSQIQTKNDDVTIPPSLPDSSEGTEKEDTSQERMDVDQAAAEDLSKSAVKAEETGDQIVGEDSATICDTDAMNNEISGLGSSGPDHLSTDAKNMTSEFKVTTIVEEEGEKSEDEGVESDLNEDEDETQPLVSPMAEHDNVLREELIKQQREREGYSTLQDDEGTIPESDRIDQTEPGGSAANIEPSADVTPVDSSVAMETDTSSAINAKITPTQSDDTDQKETSQPVEKPTIPTSEDIDNTQAQAEQPESESVNQQFVDFSSGLFTHDSSLVQDITECVQETGKSQEELKVIQKEGIEIRMKSGEDLSLSVERERSESQQSAASSSDDPRLRSLSAASSSDDARLRSGSGALSSEDGRLRSGSAASSSDDARLRSGSESNGLSKVSSATDATATKQMNYDKTNLEEFLPRPAQRYEDPPLYLCLRVSKPMQKTFSKDDKKSARPSSKGKIPEYWFAIPRDKADDLYGFFLQWTPDIYGRDIDAGDVGFVVVDQEDSSLEVVEDFFDEPITKDWEIITKEEANRRRMTILECEMNLPLPELRGSSELLEDIFIRKLAKQLPPRTEGYSWSLLYSTSNNGFSLTSLYRSMRTVDSPVLLVVKDSDNTIFGSLVSCAVKISDHYYGTGETFLFKFRDEEDLECYKWTGENNYFVKGDRDSLAIGGGDGTFGLWLDGDLYHGRSRSCKTFANEVLSQQEDFVIANIEAWHFTLPM